jgi:hypothetical protein
MPRMTEPRLAPDPAAPLGSGAERDGPSSFEAFFETALSGGKTDPFTIHLLNRAASRRNNMNSSWNGTVVRERSRTLDRTDQGTPGRRGASMTGSGACHTASTLF